MRTGITFLAAASLLALGACTNSIPADNASRNLSQTADNMAADFRDSAGNASAEIANSTAEMRNSIDNAVDRIEERAARVREATRNSASDLGNAARGQ